MAAGELVFGHAEDHGHVYQLRHGQQFNFENAFIGSMDALLPLLPDAAITALVREWDPIHLGIHRATVAHGNAVPPYIERDVDGELRARVQQAAREGGMVLLVGDSTAGKSRAAYEALMAVAPDHLLHLPNDPSSLRSALLSILTASGPHVLWLDNLESYLGPEGLTAGLVSQLRNAGVLVICTLRTAYYRQLSDSEQLGSARTSAGPSRVSETIMASLEPIILPRVWSPAELERAKEASDRRILDAVPYGDTYGLAEYLAAGPRLFREYRLAAEGGGNPRGAALVSAAIDCSRAGLDQTIPTALLEQTHEHYLRSMGGAMLRPEPFETALGWATRRRYGITSMLIPTNEPNVYRVFDYLPDALARATGNSTVPDATWNLVRNYSKGQQGLAYRVAVAAAAQGKYAIAEEIWTELATEGNPRAADRLAILLYKLGREQEAATWTEHAATGGNMAAAVRLGQLLLAAGNLTDAEKWLRAAAEKRHSRGVALLANLLEDDGRFEEAIEWYGIANELKVKNAVGGLGYVLAQTGKLDEAEALLREAADRGDANVLNTLGIVLSEGKRDEEAESVWLKAAQEGSAEAMSNLAVLYSRKKCWEEAERWARQAVASDGNRAHGALGAVLINRGKGAEGEKILALGVEANDPYAMFRLGQRHVEKGRLEEGERLLRQAVGARYWQAAGDLAELLEKKGRATEAAPYWDVVLVRGDTVAALRFGRALKERGDRVRAQDLFRRASEAGDQFATCELGRLMWQQGDAAQGEELLKHAVSMKHSHAACVLGAYLATADRFSEAIEFWELSYRNGHHHNARNISRAYMLAGRPDLAAIWLKKVNMVNTRRAKPTAKKKRRKRK